jgi:ABC-type dipeptide/oligopeptide/nickel transport system permease component
VKDIKKQVLKRLIHLAIIIIGLSFLTYLLMYIAPGDPALKKLNAQGISVSEETLENAREEMGLNEPFLVRYANWLGDALRGDLGTSYKDGLPVASKLIHALKYTLVLSSASLALSITISLPLALVTAVKKDGILDKAVKLLSFVGNSMPSFLISVLLMYFLCVKTQLLPVIAGNSVKGLIMPCLALSIPMCARFVRQFRAEILDQLGREYVLGARARGVKEAKILFCNVLRNAMIPILTVIALSVGTLLGGSVVVETMFRWPGLGKLVMESITARDYPVIQGFVIFTSCIYVLINLAVDICYHRLEPRVREM